MLNLLVEGRAPCGSPISSTAGKCGRWDCKACYQTIRVDPYIFPPSDIVLSAENLASLKRGLNDGGRNDLGSFIQYAEID